MSGTGTRRHCSRLNRTFYGIETFAKHVYAYELHVLIVPFMELKLIRSKVGLVSILVLIVPFMELKHSRRWGYLGA